MKNKIFCSWKKKKTFLHLNENSYVFCYIGKIGMRNFENACLKTVGDIF